MQDLIIYNYFKIIYGVFQNMKIKCDAINFLILDYL